jgi:methyl-accepting chemotaxis protein
MTVTRLLYLGFGLLIALFVISGVITYQHISNIAAAEAQKAEVTRPLQEAVLEMKISALQTIRGVVSYVDTHDFKDMARVKDSEKDFETYFGVFRKLAVTEEQRGFADQVNALYGDFKTTGDEIMTLADQLAADRTILREYVTAMDELIQEQMQKPAGSTEGELSPVRSEAAHEMEVQVHKAHAICAAYMVERDPRLQQRLGSVEQAFQRVMALYRDAGPTPEELKAAEQLVHDFDKVTELGSRIFATTDNIEGSVDRFHEKVVKADAILDEQVQPLIAQEVRTAREAAKRSTDLATAAIVVSAILGLLFGGLVSVLIQRRVTRPLIAMSESVAAIAQGDLTRPGLVETPDETGRLAAAFNQMSASLKSILTDYQATSAEVMVSSREIAAGAEQQVTNLTQSAASLNQMATTTEEFKTTIQEFADRARSVLEAAEETAKQAADGIALTQQSALKSEEVRSHAETAGESVQGLAAQMHRIGEVTAAVNEIAEQTKLLALNASIEAARAGEGGRGFAVVAAQVRELANQSKQAAVRIDGLIDETQKSTQNVVRRIAEGSRLSDKTAELARTMSERFERIANSIGHTTEAVRQIAAGAQQQEEGVVELAQGMAQVNTGAKGSLAAAEQARKTIAAIDERIAALSDSMAKFKT